MKTKSRQYPLFAIALLALVAAVTTQTSVLGREGSSQPYQETVIVYTGENNRDQKRLLSGVRALMDKTGLNYELRFSNWPRVYRMAKSQPNIIFFELDKTAARKDQFNWIAPLRKNNYLLIGIDTPATRQLRPDDIPSRNLTALCSETTSGCELLKEFGFEDSQIYQAKYLDRNGSLHSMLLEGRADFVMTSEQYYRDHLDQYEGLMPVFEGLEIASYLATSLDIDPELLEALRQAAQE